MTGDLPAKRRHKGALVLPLPITDRFALARRLFTADDFSRSGVDKIPLTGM
jgi:hypothetical protein